MKVRVVKVRCESEVVKERCERCEGESCEGTRQE